MTYAFVTPKGEEHALHAFHKVVSVPNGKGDLALLEELQEALETGNVTCILRLAKMIRLAQESGWESSPYIEALDRIAQRMADDGSDHG